MNPPYPAQVEPDANRLVRPLAERMDPAIGEATSVMGAVLTELLRRTLRGGVLQIGEELHGFVAEKVEATLADRTPHIEQAAADVAAHTARTTATEIAVEEVKALEHRTQETSRQLEGKIEETARTAEQTTLSTARDLTSRIDEARKEAETVTLQAARDLAGKIEEAERRVSQATQAEMQEFLHRAREGTAVFKSRLAALEAVAADLGKQNQMLRDELVHLLEDQQAKFRTMHEGLAARIAELEKPRGLRALFARLFGWRKRKAAPEIEKPPAGQEDRAATA